MPQIQEGNRSKPDVYYGAARTDLIDALPRPLGRVLDLGCATGGGHAALRAAGADHLTGIELMAEPAERAREVYDNVLVGDADALLATLEGPFDTLLCYDILEHLVDPVATLRTLRELAAPGAHVQISIPNARFIGLIVDLLFRGTFGYKEMGHRDNTHLRWYTRRDMLKVLEASGWTPVSDGPPLKRIPRIRRIVDKLTGGVVTELLCVQWYYLARTA